MIPYDDLVAALTNWRAKQGLPVVGAPQPGSGPTPTPGSGPTMSPVSPGSGPTMGSGPTAKPGSGPNRSGPPVAPPKGSYQPPPLASPDTTDDSLDVDEAALLEEAHYDNEGDDFAMNFAQVENDDESTTLGQAPSSNRDSFGGETELDPKKSRKPW
jgi:hypothetical protein